MLGFEYSPRMRICQLPVIGHPPVAVKGKCQVLVTSDSVSKACGGAVCVGRPVV